MAEWFIAAVLKTVTPKGVVGSNPTLAANFQISPNKSVLAKSVTTHKIGEKTIKINHKVHKASSEKFTKI